MQSITLTAPDISCEHCKRTIERELGDLAGVESVSVDVARRQVTVDFDSAVTSEAAIAARLDDEGYPVASART